MNPVTRYVATYVNREGIRTLMSAAQGRNTFDTASEAQAWIDAVTAVNSADNKLWGDDPQFAVPGGTHVHRPKQPHRLSLRPGEQQGDGPEVRHGLY